MAIGALLVVAGIVGGYFNPGFVNPVETARGTISGSQIISGGGGRNTLATRRLTAVLTVDYLVDGRSRSVKESVPTVAGVAEQLYGVGNSIPVYIRRGKGDTYATLAEPQPLIVVWIAIVIFGTAWIAIGWFLGRPAKAPP
jgi:hypothetical protein